MASGLKGDFAVNEKFWIIAILLIMVFLLAIWLLLDQSFREYVVRNINSQVKLCETFEKVPLLGSIRCPS